MSKGFIIITAGHHNNDPGAVANGHKEADIVKRVRDKIVDELFKLEIDGIGIITDKDDWDLKQTIAQIETTENSVCLDLHMDAAGPNAHGTTVVIPESATPFEKVEGAKLLKAVSNAAQTHPRRVIPESQTARKIIGILRQEKGANFLCELGFITNNGDLGRILKNEDNIAKAIAAWIFDAYLILNK